MKLLKLLETHSLLRDAVLSLAWLALVLAVRWFLIAAVRRVDWSSDRLNLRWQVQVRRGGLVVLTIGLVFIWGTELRTMALSLTAIAVALVIATKEMILCVMGSLLRASARAFTIGDRIEIEGVHGDVIDHGLFATTILEVGPGHLWTGRALTVPNSMFLSSPITNESFATRYVLHIIRVPISRQEIEGASDVLKAIGEEVCAPFLPEARDHLEAEAARHGLERPLVNPRVTIALVDPANVDLLLRIPTPVRDRGDIEQEVLRRWFATMV